VNKESEEFYGMVQKDPNDADIAQAHKTH